MPGSRIRSCWEAQRERIQRSGARYEHSSRNSRLELDFSDPSRVVRALGELLTAARTYGTTVLPVDPATEMPAVTPLETASLPAGGQVAEIVARVAHQHGEMPLRLATALAP